MYVKLNGEMAYLWRAVDQEGEILESFVTRKRDKEAALSFMKRTLKRHGSPEKITTDGLRPYRAAMNELGNADKQEIDRWANNRAENSHLPFRRRERAMLRLRQMKSLQKFASVHANVRNQLASPPSGSTWNATSSIDRLTSYAAQPHWPNGRTPRVSRSRTKPSLRQLETSCNLTGGTLIGLRSNWINAKLLDYLLTPLVEMCAKSCEAGAARVHAKLE